MSRAGVYVRKTRNARWWERRVRVRVRVRVGVKVRVRVRVVKVKLRERAGLRVGVRVGGTVATTGRGTLSQS